MENNGHAKVALPSSGQADVDRDIFALVASELDVDELGLLGADLEKRNALGAQIYGRPMVAHDGRVFEVEAYEELLDAIPYTRAAALNAAGTPKQHAYMTLYYRLVALAGELKRLLDS
jgi:hypothetical protein